MTAFRCSYYDRIEWDLVAQWNEWFLSENLYRYFHLSTSHTRSPAYQFLAGALAILAIVVAIAIHDISWPAPNLANILFRFVSQTYTLGFLLLLFLFMNITSVNYNTIAKKSIRSSSPTMSVWAVCVWVKCVRYFHFIFYFYCYILIGTANEWTNRENQFRRWICVHTVAAAVYRTKKKWFFWCNMTRGAVLTQEVNVRED